MTLHSKANLQFVSGQDVVLPYITMRNNAQLVQQMQICPLTRCNQLPTLLTNGRLTGDINEFLRIDPGKIN